MLASLNLNLRRPVIFLLTSFVIGLMIDAVAEKIAAQETETPVPASIGEIGSEQSPQDVRDQTSSGMTESYSEKEIGEPLMDLDISIRDVSGRTPPDESAGLFARFGSSNYPGTFQDRLAMWCAPNIRYQPLYFEDVGLERYGQTHGPIIQPVASAAHYGASLSLFGLNVVKQHPLHCDYPLGYCRPGTLVPRTKTRWFWKK